MRSLSRVLGWLVRHPWVLVILALALAVLYARAETRSLRHEVQELRSSQTEGFRTLEAGIAQRPAPVIVPGPTLNPFDNDGARWDEVFAELADLKAQMKDSGAKPQAVAVVRAETRANSVTWKWGETVTTRRLSIYPIPENRYRLDLNPSRLRVAVSRATDGQWFAQVFDETAGEPLTVSAFDVHEEEPGLRWEWFRWSVGAGLGSDADGNLGPDLWGGVSLLRIGKPGGLRWDVLNLTADRYAARLGMAVGN